MPQPESVTLTILEGFVGYVSFCSYGDYSSRRYGTPGRASMSGKAHCRKSHPGMTIVVLNGERKDDG